uniref:probable LRR receptor-like serine/threonine-protein kinase At3g47570 n=1 Tax=Erigeron canadensis TaxID=72917 RepID=UPI001CB8CD19|nr:probable LRR receptor-like serine/threonine-protein kinase At3g47570 [Erigeron canadensis]
MKSSQPIICLSSFFHTSFLCTVGLVIFLNTITISVSDNGNETDTLALLSFKSMITLDPNGVLSSWNTSLHFCDWSGISCGKKHQRVTIVNLTSQGLTGSLSPHLGNLSFLYELRLGNNSFEGSIPNELGHLSRLRVLALFRNKLYGIIPTNLSGCINLEEIRLSNNKLIGNIPTEISFLSKLTYLSINYNNLTGGISPFLGNITLMEVFSVANNSFGGSIPDTLGRWKNLREFYVGTCNLHGTIPDSLFNNTLLTRFSVANNQIQGSIPIAIGSMLPNLVYFQLRGNQMTGVLPPSISNCSKLQFLEISYNQFSGKVAVDFGNMRDLVNVSLGVNLYGSWEADEMKFIDSLKNCSMLETLALYDCRFQGVLPISIGYLSDQLQTLELSDNKLYGEIPSSIGNLVNVGTLSLEYNQFTGKIPSTIGKLQNLQVVALHHNQLSGPIPDEIGNLSLLTKLMLSSNRLEGNIPSSLGNFLQILQLSLDDNKLSGNIPKQLFQLSSLTIVLNLSQNSLSGSIPPEVGHLKSLNELDLSYNNLSGSIPSSLGACTSLSSISLERNLFQGIIPPSFSSLRGVVHLDLSNNNFLGKIPQFLEQFSLEYMNLSFNNFEGEVPIKGVFANASAFSFFGNNRLCGGLVNFGLPKCKEAQKHKKRLPLFVKIILISFILISVVLFGLLSYVFILRKKKRKDQVSQLSSLEKRFLKVSYNQLLKVTDGFSENNLIGKGGFSSVYKGTLDQEDSFVAVKVLHLQNRGAHKSFLSECEAWRSIRHRNLLKIITSCSSVDFQGNDFKALVYEFMPNGSLHDWLHSRAIASRLNFLQKINIFINIASAIDYLHNHCLPTVVHGDLKPSNILLDDDMVAHVGDFGLARFLGTDVNQNISTGVKGTIGYAPPEYGVGSEMTSNGDVYSFGILLLEVMTGKRPTDDIFSEGFSLHKFACDALPDHVIDIIDDSAIDMQNTEANARKMEECLASTIKIGVSCSLDSPTQRMNIEIVVHELQHILDVLQNM